MADETTNDTPVAEAPAAPVLRVVNPDATPEEIAALVAVFSAMGGGQAPAPKRPRSQWSAPERGARRTLPHGLGGWRSSGMPR
ncbi:acyl-CoA carboxylase subunit epsilon [Nocardioides jishulii]|uniref:Acyl-CoA carboxylase subunit epsilon n=1 Tax=Nocardioides jishulii TaxID=2575440 RepID=A0A4U2YII7_9ACTN|nr:acyl-CoA carboxylase subunit epsilon [Nocardioides jishulii]QCX28252.1 acyl-CoA carboxylase subunit epsilon [Nocardioides jishulii]TKI60916.1 acyl-CoA carboxylase subunit epsilon [Nocardioides jishulii]